jgi:adenosylcobyric acid synthase
VTPRRGALMVCGTGSDAGKSTVVVGLCRLLAREGVSVAPFKGQNMSLNSMVTADGAEIGRAQWLQALAAGAVPEAAMNPVLLKPTGERTSQVVVMGRPQAVHEAGAYQGFKAELVHIVDAALADLRSRFDVVLCEGAGSPAEINLLEDDLVNLGLAHRAGLPAVLVGDIERGGVFAHLYGTVAILPDHLRPHVRAFIVNRFRGDRTLLGDATAQLERRCGVPTLGVLPHLGELVLDAEDSLQLGVGRRWSSDVDRDVLDVAVVRFPRVSNFTDLDPLAIEPGVAVRYVDHPSLLGQPDLIVLPGSKATVADLEWLRASGMAGALEGRRTSAQSPVLLGVCGGFQMLGAEISDPSGVESAVAASPGLGWLPLRTTFDPDKVTRLRGATDPTGAPVEGYEIHHGRAAALEGRQPWLAPTREDEGDVLSAIDRSGLVCGTALHGLFEADDFRRGFLLQVAAAAGKSWQPGEESFAAAREAQIDRVADACAEFLDLDALWALLMPRGRCA